MVLQVKVMAVVVAGARPAAGEMMAAVTAAAVLAAGEGVGRGDERAGCQRKRGNGGCKEFERGGHRFSVS
jgi:hypothetical protein